MSRVHMHTSAEEPSIAISAVVPTRLGAGRLPRCLDSLIDQDITIGYEIIVVQYGPDDGNTDGGRGGGTQAPRHTSSTRELRRTNARGSKNLGWSQSVGRIVVFVHDEDRVSRRFLSAMVDIAPEDDQIVLPLRVADLGDRPADVRAPAVLGLLAHAGHVVAPQRVASSLAPGVGIAFPAAS